MAYPNHVRLTKRSHFDHRAHSILVGAGSDPGIITVVRASSASERVWAAERLTTNKSSRRDHHQATPQKGDRTHQQEPVRRIDSRECHMLRNVHMWGEYPVDEEPMDSMEG